MNPGKFQAIIFDKRKVNRTNRIININQKEIKAVAKVKLLGIEIYDKLNFNNHINNICKSASNQINALIRLKHLIGFQERKVLVNTFVMSNFNNCSLVVLGELPRGKFPFVKFPRGEFSRGIFPSRKTPPYLSKHFLYIIH